MTTRGNASSGEPYSPQRRTALVLTGIGTAGAYHAGVLRALHEAGVKLDVVAGRGVGVIGALFAAFDGGARLWEDNGFWRAAAVQKFYRWRLTLRVMVWALVAAAVLVLAPIAAVAAGLVVFPLDFVLKIAGIQAAGGLVGRYLTFAEAAFAPGALPTWLPRLVLLVLGAAALMMVTTGWLNRDDRRRRGPFWWRVVRAPLSTGGITAHCWTVMWDLVRGASPIGEPVPAELGRRYIEMLSENIGQPGFRELVVSVHDMDARRDLVFALVESGRRRDLTRRSTSGETEERQAAIQDLGGIAGNHLPDAVAGALAIPLMTEFHTITFAPESYWRGESHRIADRPAGLQRLVEELVRLDVRQVLLVSASPESAEPHALAAVQLDARSRLGEYLQSSESACVRDVQERYAEGMPRIFTIRPAHNPVGPFDFSGGFDDGSDRRQPIAELITQGYEDACRQFIEPVLGASGERVGQMKNLELKT